MKTFRLKTTLVAGLAAAVLAGSACAEEEGFVRLGKNVSGSQTSTAADARVVARGQSAPEKPNKQAPVGLLQLLSPDYDEPTDTYEEPTDTYDEPTAACDSCCPVDCDDCCPVDCDDCCPAECGDGCDGCGDGLVGDSGTLFGIFGDLRARRAARRARRHQNDWGYCEHCGGYGCRHCRGSFLERHLAQYHARRRANNARLNAYLRCKLGYFIHDGCGGAGCPPFGHYSIVYPDNPPHFDGRDGQIYAAQGVGGPVSVPTAPIVRHAYNYGWGVPSSRLTPISNAAY